MNLKKIETLGKENHYLAIQRANVFTEIAFNPNVVMFLEFVFKSTGKRLPKLLLMMIGRGPTSKVT